MNIYIEFEDNFISFGLLVKRGLDILLVLVKGCRITIIRGAIKWQIGKLAVWQYGLEIESRSNLLKHSSSVESGTNILLYLKERTKVLL